jgi:hypothetical protein
MSFNKIENSKPLIQKEIRPERFEQPILFLVIIFMTESDKIGFQFNEIDLETKYNKLIHYLNESKVDKSRIKIVRYPDEIINDDSTYFILSTREYTKKRNFDEINFMKYLLPEKAKFIPIK